LSNEAADSFFRSLIAESISSITPVLLEQLHNLSVMYLR
jgi:hypothetical protein